MPNNNPITAAEKRTIGYVLALIETVNENPNGAPAGICYAAFMQAGLSLEQYQFIEDVAVRAGAVSKRGHLLYPTRP